MKVIVFHDSYGCETGCCGHQIEVYDDENNLLKHRFKFDHLGMHGYPEDQRQQRSKEFALKLVEREYGKEHCENLDWESCYISDD